MQQTAHVSVWRRWRRPRAALSLSMLGLVLPAIVSAAIPTVINLSLTPTSPFKISMSAEVTSNGGSPLWERGFVYALTSVDAAPVLFAPGTSTITVPVGVGSMTRDLDVVPGFSYSVQAYARNVDGIAYSGVKSATAPCPAILLSGLPDSSLGASYGSYADAYGGSGAYVYGVTSGALPPGLTLDTNSGYVSGNPTTPGTYGFTIAAADANWACGGSRTYSVKISTLDVQPSKIAFASEVVGNPSPTAYVTLTNYDSNEVSLGSVVSSAPEFAVTGTTCGAALPAFTSCTLDIVFTPGSAATFSGNITVSPALIAVRGSGVATAVSQVYSVNYSGGTVSVIDPVTNVVRKTVVVGSNPGNLKALPGGARVYVPNQSSSTVSVIDTSDYSVTEISSGFSGPRAVAPTPQGNEVWVLNSYSNSISVIDTATDGVVATVPASGCIASFSDHIVANPANLEMYVLSGDGNICVFDRGSRGFLRAIPVGGYLGFGVVIPDGSAMYVTGGSGVATRVNLASGALSIVAGAPGRNMDMKADGSKIYVAQGSSGFGFITTASNTFTAIPLTSPGYLEAAAVHDAAGRVYVTDSNSNAVYVVDLATDTEVPNPEFPIRDSYFSAPMAIAAVKAAGPVGEPPTVTTGTGTGSYATAGVTGSVLADGGLTIFERGFAYSTTDPSPVPGAFDVLTAPVSGTLGAMSTTLTGLVSGSTYYFRAYAKNVAGTGLGAAGTFSTLSCPSIAIDPTFLPNATAGVPYSATLTASGAASGPYSFTFSTSPPGINGFSTGALSGTPTAAGTYTMRVTATDVPTGCWASAMYDLVVGTPVAAGGVVISEFRTRGPNGPDDEYVEIGNRTSADVVVASTDGSGGWSIGRPGQVIAVIPDGTLIPKGGHWLATNIGFSLYFSGIPSAVQSGDRLMVGVDIPDDAGFGLFSTADSGAYTPATRLDAVGGVAETDPLFYEGTPLPAVVQAGPTNPTAETAWVRRLTNAAVLSDSEDNDRDFIFVATDAGTTYGPLGDVAAVLGGPNPEDTKAVHDVLQSEFPVALLDPSAGENSYPNRQKYSFYNPRALEYRRTFTNNTGKEIHALTFKVISLTTLNSRQTIPAQSQLRIVDAPQRTIEVPTGSNVYVDTRSTQLENPSIYTLEWYDNSDDVYRLTGGMNSRVLVPFASRLGLETKGLKPLSSSILPSETVAVNFKTAVITKGYYLFVLVPQVSFDPPEIAQEAARAPRNER